MMFSYVHKKTTRPAVSQNNESIPSSVMVFGIKPRPLMAVKLPQTNTPVQVRQQPILPKMKWGKPVWTFFHVMSQKIKPEYFNLVIKDFLNFVLMICSALPCPICSAHASEYLRAINFNNIRSKEDLINLFFVFHNVVNQRKSYAVLQRDNIPSYENENTVVVLRNFIYAFEDKSRSMKLMADDLARSRISARFKFWINENLKYFEP